MFYDNLKAVCDAQGLKVTPIVAECGGAKGSISNWKKGAMPNSDIVAKLAVRLNVSTDLLIFGTDKRESTGNKNYTQNVNISDAYGENINNTVGDNVAINNQVTTTDSHTPIAKDSECSEIYAEIIEQLEALNLSDRFNALFKIKRILDDDSAVKKKDK